MDYIKEQITQWLKEILVSGITSNLSGMFDSVNQKVGEISTQVLLAVFWGGFGAEHKYIAVAAIMAWGPGDAVAAIVGKNFGKHKLQGKMIEGVKSVEGSVGMAVTSFLCTLPVLLTMSNLPWHISLLFAVVIAPIASLTELFTRKGFDTVTVPFVSALILSLAMILG